MKSQIITINDLREKSSHLVKNILAGKGFRLIYRSKLIAKIIPTTPSFEKIITNPQDLKNIFAEIKPKVLIPKKERRKIYRKHLKEKYVKNFS